MLSGFPNGHGDDDDDVPTALPSLEARADIYAKLAVLVRALQAHPMWSPTATHNGLYHVWDFVNRSKYIMSELDNIQAGRPVLYPEQIPPTRGATSPTHAAMLSFQDVCTRAFTVDAMIQNPRMLVRLGLSQLDFGNDVRVCSRAVNEAIATAAAAS